MSAIEHEITDDEMESILDDIYGTVEVCGFQYDSGALLKEIDPTAFRCAKSDMMRWECSECGTVFEEESDAEECCEEEEEEKEEEEEGE